MLIGRDDSALDRAIEHIKQGRLPEPNDLFILAFDPQRGVSRLYKINELKDKDLKPDAAKAFLTGRFTFFNNDLDRLSGLLRRGYRKLILLTDNPPRNQSVVEVIDLGRNPAQQFFFPLRQRFDPDEKRFVVTLYQRNLDVQPQLRRYNTERNSFEPYTEFTYVRGSSAQFSIAEDGLYQLREEDLDFVVDLRRPLIEVAVDGLHARIILETIPFLQEGGDRLQLIDIQYPNKAGEIPIRLNRLLHRKTSSRIVTFIPGDPAPESGLYLHPLQSTLSLPALSEFPSALFALKTDPRTRVFYQNTKGLPESQTPFAYLTGLDRFSKGKEMDRAALLYRGSSSFVYQRAGRVGQTDRLRAVNLAARELFPIPPPELSLDGRPHRVLLFILLLGLYLLKLLFLQRYYLRRH
jgi:hypothetical protein